MRNINIAKDIRPGQNPNQVVSVGFKTAHAHFAIIE